LIGVADPQSIPPHLIRPLRVGNPVVDDEEEARYQGATIEVKLRLSGITEQA
jgi:hypothetical protein